MQLKNESPALFLARAVKHIHFTHTPVNEDTDVFRIRIQRRVPYPLKLAAYSRDVGTSEKVRGQRNFYPV